MNWQLWGFLKMKKKRGVKYDTNMADRYFSISNGSSVDDSSGMPRREKERGGKK